MGKIKMLNLFRCSSVGERMTEKDIHYFVTDYFDGIKVENLHPESTTLAECMGIKKDANESNTGTSHQRYCLYSDDESEYDIFETDQEFPLLTVIQVFINPDIYQADHFTEDEKEISCESCMDKVRERIEKNFSEEEKTMRWQIYRLLTAGDFAVIVRSNKIHNAYDISTLIRGTNIMLKGTEKNVSAFFTYSISGVLDKYNDKQDVYKNINWPDYLNDEDRIMVRVVFDREKIELNPYYDNILALGYRLLGRYDYQIECTPQEFQEIYPYIRNYKLGTTHIIPEISISDISSPTEYLLWMMKEEHVLRINEKIFLRYKSDKLLIKEIIEIEKNDSAEGWISLYEENEKIISDLKDLAVKLEKKLSSFYQSERNLKEYTRLLGRFCRILHEINQMRELRISAANLSNQLSVMLHSLQTYLDNTKSNKCEKREIADKVSKFLQMGINSLEIFARYVKNINLQTLQTPNYDLQTNICIEKILLAYSQFLQPFLVKQRTGAGKKEPYYFSGTLYPIIVPDMGVRDLSVCVLFDDCHFESNTSKEKTYEKLMIVNIPTFFYLCETCFLLPAIFHEIAHQFRYESHERRNRCLEAYLLKGVLCSIILEFIDKYDKYGFGETEIEKVVDDVYERIKGRFLSDEMKENGLQYFKAQFEKKIQEFMDFNPEPITPTSVIKRYMEKTKGDVRIYNNDLLRLIDSMEQRRQDLEKNFADNGYYKEDLEGLLKDFKQYFILQENQIFEEIIGILKKNVEKKRDYGKTEQAKTINNCISELLEIDKEQKKGGGIIDKVQEKGRKMFAFWEKLDKIDFDFVTLEDLKSLLKHYHNLCNAYNEVILNWKPENMDLSTFYYNFFHNICAVIQESLLRTFNDLDHARRQQLDWEAIPLENERLEQIKRKIKFEEEKGIQTKMKGLLFKYQGGRLKEFIDSKISAYREITSDLFMCSIMRLNSFGYLVVAAETFIFNGENEFALYRRISFVLQCLSQRRKGAELTTEEFSEELLEILCEQLNILKNEATDSFVVQKTRNVSDVNLEEIDSYLTSLRHTGGLTTTQDWILRILLQISYIIFNIKDTCLAREEFSEKEIWADMVSEESYIGCERKEAIKKILYQNGGAELCGSIAQILNSPASYFKEKQYLLTKEIDFILSHYEENCRQIFRIIHERHQNGNSSI